ncbi:MAG TPA: dihydrolipoyl dehydrogenase, partial [Bacillota bacterium]|nr:dihydrolipoyl dehydrogenase [Bacillota bacterium]
MNKYDLVVIGSGAGLMVMEAALSYGWTVAVVEKDRMGGTCLTKGCIPSKMLVYPAEFIREAESSTRFGVDSGPPKLNWEKVSQRMWEQIDFSNTIESNLGSVPGLTLYRGEGSFVSSHELMVKDDNGEEVKIYGEHFLIAAGAKSLIPTVPGLEDTGYITSETFFGKNYPEKPWKRLVIIGSGAISTEFAHIFSSFGTQVTMIARSARILRKEDREISHFLHQQLTDQGIEIIPEGKINQVYGEKQEKVLVVEVGVSGEKRTLHCDEILVASGSVTTTDRLSLDKAGINTDNQGWIPTNEYLETNQPHIWALGDINGKYQFRHKANHEAQVLSHNLFSGKKRKKARYEATPWAIFTHPQVARVGKTEEELIQEGTRYVAAKNYYSDVVGGRSMGIRKEDPDNGFVKMLVGMDKKILGVHIVGPQAAVLVQPFVYLMNLGFDSSIGTYELIQDSMIIHPSLSELTAWVF